MLLDTADSVMDTKKKLEFGVQQIIFKVKTQFVCVESIHAVLPVISFAAGTGKYLPFAVGKSAKPASLKKQK